MKTPYMVISFEDNGEVNAMHRDQFDLGFLGNQKIERASEIKFNETTQKWDIYLPTEYMDVMVWKTTDEAQGYATYEKARAAEVAWLEWSKLAGVNPFSEEALLELSTINFAMDGGAVSFGVPPA